MSGRSLLFAVGLVLLSGARAAPLERDLGQGLRYVRVSDLPADLPAAPVGRPAALVADLRYVAAGSEAAAAFSAWLKQRAALRAPVLVLANVATSAALRAAWAETPRDPGVIVIGIAGPGFTPDLAVPSTAERERAAYDALAEGTAVAALLTDQPEKVRLDEARLAKGPSPPPAGEGAAPARTPPAPVIDAALQRAVHLHRSLLALRKL